MITYIHTTRDRGAKWWIDILSYCWAKRMNGCKTYVLHKCHIIYNKFNSCWEHTTTTFVVCFLLFLNFQLCQLNAKKSELLASHLNKFLRLHSLALSGIYNKTIFLTNRIDCDLRKSESRVVGCKLLAQLAIQ